MQVQLIQIAGGPTEDDDAHLGSGKICFLTRCFCCGFLRGRTRLAGEWICRTSVCFAGLSCCYRFLRWTTCRYELPTVRHAVCRGELEERGNSSKTIGLELVAGCRFLQATSPRVESGTADRADPGQSSATQSRLKRDIVAACGGDGVVRV
jgi:hypothetical protein